MLLEVDAERFKDVCKTGNPASGGRRQEEQQAHCRRGTEDSGSGGWVLEVFPQDSNFPLSGSVTCGMQ